MTDATAKAMEALARARAELSAGIVNADIRYINDALVALAERSRPTEPKGLETTMEERNDLKRAIQYQQLGSEDARRWIGPLLRDFDHLLSRASPVRKAEIAAVEREACAAIADRQMTHDPAILRTQDERTTHQNCAWQIAAAIRARKEPEHG